MKKSFSLIIAVFMLSVIALAPCAYASPEAYMDSGDSGDVNIAVTGGKSIELTGHIEPVIISVVMPSSIPFDISYSLEGDNKVVSPQINVTNNSLVPVSIGVDRTDINLTSLPGVTWSSNGVVSDTQIAVGLYTGPAAPTRLDGAKWLRQGVQNLHLMSLDSSKTESMFIVGTLGRSVMENTTFSVTPTLIVKRA